MSKHSYNEIANSLNLWNEYFNTGAAMTDDEFHALDVDARVALLVEAFGPESADA